jgi:hypothetical protein
MARRTCPTGIGPHLRAFHEAENPSDPARFCFVRPCRVLFGLVQHPARPSQRQIGLVALAGRHHAQTGQSHVLGLARVPQLARGCAPEKPEKGGVFVEMRVEGRVTTGLGAELGLGQAAVGLKS